MKKWWSSDMDGWKTFILCVLIIFFFIVVANAETYHFKQKEADRKIEVKQEKEFLLITTYPIKGEPIIYRVWPCGKIEKLTWKQLNENQDRGAGTLIYEYPRFTITPGTDITLPYIISPNDTKLVPGNFTLNTGSTTLREFIK